MVDLQLDTLSQDLVLKSPVTNEYDLELTQQVQDLLVAGFSIPYRSRKVHVLDPTQGLLLLDSEIGNLLYELLSEPFSLSWMQEAKTALQSVFNQLDLPVELIELTSNWVQEGIEIQLTYRDLNQSINQTQFLLSS